MDLAGGGVRVRAADVCAVVGGVGTLQSGHGYGAASEACGAHVCADRVSQ